MKVILVVGGSRGIGFELSKQLLKKTDNYVISTCTNGSIEQLKIAFEKNQNALGFCLDVKNENKIIELRDFIDKKFGRLDSLINCVGIPEKDCVTTENESTEIWDEIMNVNLRGPYLTCKNMIPLLRKSKKPHIINFSGQLGSISNGMDGGTMTAYRISKLGISALSLILSNELKNDRIMVNSVDPGWVRTDLGGLDAPKEPYDVAKEIEQLLELNYSLDLTGKLLKEGRSIPF